MNPAFLRLSEVLAIHRDQIDRYGGISGLRDMDLLKSALGMPMATFHGAFLDGSLHEMAAAYLFHLVRNHPFVDGNKQTGTVAAMVFLLLNGQSLEVSPDDLAALVLDVAQGALTKAEIAIFFQSHTHAVDSG